MKSNLAVSQLQQSARPSSAQRQRIRMSNRGMFQSPPAPAVLHSLDSQQQLGSINELSSRFSMTTPSKVNNFCSQYGQIVSGRRGPKQHHSIFYPKTKKSLYGGDSDYDGTGSIRSSQKSVRRSWARFYCGSQNTQNEQIQQMEVRRTIKLQNFQREANKVKDSYECINTVSCNQRRDERIREAYIADLGVIISKKDEEIHKKNNQIQELTFSLQELEVKMKGLRMNSKKGSELEGQRKSAKTQKWVVLAQAESVQERRMNSYKSSKELQASDAKINELQEKIKFLQQQQKSNGVQQRNEKEWARLFKQNKQLLAEINRLRLLSSKSSNSGLNGKPQRQHISHKTQAPSQQQHRLSQGQTELKQKLQSLSSQNIQQQNHIAQLTNQIWELKSQISNSKQLKSQSESDIQKLKHEISMLTSQNQRLTDSNTTLQQQVSNYRMVEVTLKKTQNQLKQLSLRRQMEARKMQQVNKELTHKQQHSRSLQTAERETKRLNQLNHTLTQQKSTLQAELKHSRQSSLRNIDSLNMRLRSQQQQINHLEQLLKGKNKESSERSLNQVKLQSEIRAKDDLLKKMRSINAANKEQIMKMGKNSQSLLLQVRNISQKYLRISEQLKVEQSIRQQIMCLFNLSQSDLMKFVVSMHQQSEKGFILQAKYRQIIENNRHRDNQVNESLKSMDQNPETKIMSNIYEILSTNIWNLIEIRMTDLQSNIIKSLKVNTAKTDSIAKLVKNGLAPQLKHSICKRVNKNVKKFQGVTFFTNSELKIKKLLIEKVGAQTYQQQMNPIISSLFEEINKISQQTSEMRNNQYELEMDNHMLYDDNAKFIEELNHSHEMIVHLENSNLSLKTTLSAMEEKFKANYEMSNKYKDLIRQQNEQAIKNLMISKNSFVRKM